MELAMNKANHIQGTTKVRKAFTLVELLVVIGIIAVLIGILLPTLGRAKAQATTVACMANLRSIGQAVQLYTGIHKGALPYGYWDGIGSPDGNTVNGGSSATDWQLLLLSIALGKGGSTYGDQAGSETSKLQEAFACPAAFADSGNAAGNFDRKLHYSSHPRLMPNLDDTDRAVAPPRPLLKGWKISKIRRSTEIALIFDGSQDFGTNRGNAYAVGNGIDDGGLYARSFLLARPTVNLGESIKTDNRDFSVGPRADIRWRHGKNNTANVLFADGHAESRALTRANASDLLLRNVCVDQ